MILNRDIEENENNYGYDGKYKEIDQKDDEREEINKKKSHSKKKNFKSSKEKILYFEILIIIIISILIVLLLIKIITKKYKIDKEKDLNKLDKKYLNNDTIKNNTIQKNLNNDTINNNITIQKNNKLNENINETKTLTFDEQKKNEEEEKLNKIKNQLMEIYDKIGKVNIMNFYEEYISQKNYTLPQLEQYNNIHINIGFTDDKIDSIIKHISSILYKADKSTFLHIHMMDAGIFDYDSMRKLVNMICKINNLTEIIVYNATQVLNDFLIRADSVSKFSIEYAKLYAFKVIKDVKKIIFIDADDCIIQKDLNELYSLDMDHIYARGITDEPSIRYSMNWMDKYLYDRTHYINGGVILINLELCQKKDFYEKAKDLNNDVFYTKTEEPAQDIINVLLRKRIEFFHPKYNKINYYEKDEDRNDESKWYKWMEQTLKIGSRNNHFYNKEELIEADKDPVIIHYAWDRYLHKTIKKYEEDIQFYGNLTGIN